MSETPIACPNCSQSISITGTFNPNSSPTNGPANTITGAAPEKNLYPWFENKAPASL
ncbi:MAG TPA: hypothetical protein VJA21_19230 [Verrucomicrobiae bacterium]